MRASRCWPKKWSGVATDELLESWPRETTTNWRSEIQILMGFGVCVGRTALLHQEDWSCCVHGSKTNFIFSMQTLICHHKRWSIQQSQSKLKPHGGGTTVSGHWSIKQSIVGGEKNCPATWQAVRRHENQVSHCLPDCKCNSFFRPCVVKLQRHAGTCLNAQSIRFSTVRARQSQIGSQIGSWTLSFCTKGLRNKLDHRKDHNCEQMKRFIRNRLTNQPVINKEKGHKTQTDFEKVQECKKSSCLWTDFLNQSEIGSQTLRCSWKGSQMEMAPKWFTMGVKNQNTFKLARAVRRGQFQEDKASFALAAQWPYRVCNFTLSLIVFATCHKRWWGKPRTLTFLPFWIENDDHFPLIPFGEHLSIC